MGSLRSESQSLQPACLSRTASSPSPSSDNNFSTTPPWTDLKFVNPNSNNNRTIFINQDGVLLHAKNPTYQNLELQLLTTTTSSSTSPVEIIRDSHKEEDEKNDSTQLQLSIGSSEIVANEKPRAMAVKEQAREELRLAMAEKAYAEEARRQAKRQIELAEREFSNAKRIRQQAQAELDKAQALKEHATKQINTAILQITCHACKNQFQSAAAAAAPPPPPDENSPVLSYMSSAITEGEVEHDNNRADHHPQFGRR